MYKFLIFDLELYWTIRDRVSLNVLDVSNTYIRVSKFGSSQSEISD
jgi:hypothetical protein